MALVLAGIEKFFAGTAVLKEISLSIEEGEFLTLVGPKDCGKSILLRILAGLEAPDIGNIDLVDGGGQVPALRMVSTRSLKDELTVFENLAAPLRKRDLSWFQRMPLAGSIFAPEVLADISSKVHVAAEQLQIDDLLDRKTGTLSNSHKQRVAIAQALVCGPTACLFDDPYRALDHASRSLLRAELFELHHLLGVTIIYATSDPSEALKMPDRMVVLLDGRIAQIGPPDAVYDDPDTLAVAKFVGAPSVNLLPGELSVNGQLSVFGRVVGHFRTPIAKAITVGIRPEAVLVDPTSASLSGVVRRQTTHQGEPYLQVEVRGITLCVSATNISDDLPKIGTRVSLAFVPDKLLLFEADGSRLRLPMLSGCAGENEQSDAKPTQNLIATRSLG